MLQFIELKPSVPPRASVIWLHGLGANGEDFYEVAKQLALTEEFGAHVLLPHAPVRKITYAQHAPMRAWFNFAEVRQGSVEDVVGIRASEQAINALIAQELALGIPSTKIVLVGFSQGGAMALQCGLRYPKPLAGLLALSTWLPLAATVAPERSLANQTTPIVMMHGTRDSMIPLTWATTSQATLQELGYAVELRTYNMAHNLCAPELADIKQWFLKLLG